MSNYQNHNQSSELEPVLFLIGGGLIAVTVLMMIFAKNVSVWFGAEYWTTLWALVHTAVALVVALGAVVGCYALGIFKIGRLKSSAGLVLSVIATVLAWTFCKVADSAAMGGVNPDRPDNYGFMPYNSTDYWYTGWVQWAVCLGLIIVVIGFGLSAAQDDY